jgi:hypothetical protein
MTISHARRTLVALAAVLTLTLAGCGGEEPEADTAAATTEPSPSDEKPARKSGTDKKTSAPDPVDEVVVDVSIVGDDVTPVAQRVELAVGETLLLEVNSDRAGELHVHSSPEQFADFEAGASRLDFTFDKPGSVDIEEHESGALIARVLVQ